MVLDDLVCVLHGRRHRELALEPRAVVRVKLGQDQLARCLPRRINICLSVLIDHVIVTFFALARLLHDAEVHTVLYKVRRRRRVPGTCHHVLRRRLLLLLRCGKDVGGHRQQLLHQSGKAVDEPDVGLVRKPRQHVHLALARGVDERKADLLSSGEAFLVPRVLYGDVLVLRSRHAQQQLQVDDARRGKNAVIGRRNAVAHVQLQALMPGTQPRRRRVLFGIR